MNFKNLMTLATLISLVYGIFSLRSYLFDNFVYHDTQIKQSFNKFLNGEVPKKP